MTVHDWAKLFHVDGTWVEEWARDAIRQCRSACRQCTYPRFGKSSARKLGSWPGGDINGTKKKSPRSNACHGIAKRITRANGHLESPRFSRDTVD
jgi:hypothetical protein